MREDRGKGESDSDGRYDKWQKKRDIPAFPTSQQFSLYFCKYKAMPWQQSFILLPDLYEHSPASETGDVDSHLLTPQWLHYT